MTWKRPYLRNLNRMAALGGQRNEPWGRGHWGDVLLYDLERRIDPRGRLASETFVASENEPWPEAIPKQKKLHPHLVDLYTIAWADGLLDKQETHFLYHYMMEHAIPVHHMRQSSYSGYHAARDLRLRHLNRS